MIKNSISLALILLSMHYAFTRDVPASPTFLRESTIQPAEPVQALLIVEIFPPVPAEEIIDDEAVAVGETALEDINLFLQTRIDNEAIRTNFSTFLVRFCALCQRTQTYDTDTDDGFSALFTDTRTNITYPTIAHALLQSMTNFTNKDSLCGFVDSMKIMLPATDAENEFITQVPLEHAFFSGIVGYCNATIMLTTAAQ